MHRPLYRWLELTSLVGAIFLLPERMIGQTPSRGADAIMADDIARHVGVIADDSMSGRETPSPGLEKTAQYVADQFGRLGLKPDGDSGTWFQRYPIPPHFDFARSRLVFAVGERRAATTFAAAARLASSSIPAQAMSGGVVVVSGRHTIESLKQISARNKIIVYVPSPVDPLDHGDVIRRLGRDSKGVVLVSDEDSAGFTARLEASLRRPIVQIRDRWVVYIRPDGVAGLRQLLAAGGLDLAKASTDNTPLVRELSSVTVTFEPYTMPRGDGARGVNTVGMIAGSDSALGREAVVFSAHMDHTGIRRGQPDSIANGANDNASGVAGLIALAKAFSQPGARPKRSVIFVATSGGATNLSGSQHFARRVRDARSYGQIFAMLSTSLEAKGGDGRNIIASINLDMIGDAPGDSIAVSGLGEVELATPLPWIAAAHPELGLTVGDAGTAGTPESDHFWFYRNAVPSMAFQNGSHDASRETPDSAAAVHAERTARIVRLAFYVGQDIANGERRPRWTPEGRRQYLDMVQP